MKKEKICGIYKIINPSGKIYVGESYDIERRFRNYNNLRCKAQTKLYNSLVKHSPDRHIFTIIEECSIEDLKCKERYWQIFYNVLGEKGLNSKIEPCGEEKAILRQSLIKKLSDNSNPFNLKLPVTVPPLKGK